MGRVDPKLINAVLSLVGSEKIANSWWNTPNLAFHMDTPLSVYAINPNTIKAYLEQYTQCEGS